jgi:hypothetical protein
MITTIIMLIGIIAPSFTLGYYWNFLMRTEKPQPKTKKKTASPKLTPPPY